MKNNNMIFQFGVNLDLLFASDLIFRFVSCQGFKMKYSISRSQQNQIHTKLKYHIDVFHSFVKYFIIFCFMTLK